MKQRVDGKRLWLQGKLLWLVRKGIRGWKLRRSWRKQTNWRRKENCKTKLRAHLALASRLCTVAQGAAGISARIERARSHARRRRPNCRTPARKCTVAAADNRSTS